MLITFIEHNQLNLYDELKSLKASIVESRLLGDSESDTWQNFKLIDEIFHYVKNMKPSWEADKLVQVRSVNIDRYKRNFLRQAICELRFPTLMELGEAQPPASFVKALRKEYPHLELANEVTLGIGAGSSGSNHSHIFRSSKLTWTVSLRQSAITIETTAYSDYAAFRERVLKVVDAASTLIDSDFFTRIGLRYINVIDSGDEDPIDGWINPSLVGALDAKFFSGVNEYAGRIALTADDGGCLVQHGLQLMQPRKGAPLKPEYVVDIDSFRSEVTLQDVEFAIDAMHSQAFDVFDWSLDEKARAYLSSK